jgi:hypothetical protein
MAERKQQPRQESGYKCPYGDRHCGEKAVYCERCNRDYEKFLQMIGPESR